MNVSESVEGPNPGKLFSYNDSPLEKANQLVLVIITVNLLKIAWPLHVEEKQGQEHNELFQGWIGHFPSEILSIVLEEFGVSDFRDSAHVDQGELPGQKGEHDDDTNEENGLSG